MRAARGKKAKAAKRVSPPPKRAPCYPRPLSGAFGHRARFTTHTTVVALENRVTLRGPKLDFFSQPARGPRGRARDLTSAAKRASMSFMGSIWAMDAEKHLKIIILEL